MKNGANLSERTLFLACRNFLAKQKFGRWAHIISVVVDHKEQAKFFKDKKFRGDLLSYVDSKGHNILDSLLDLNSGFDERSLPQPLSSEIIEDLINILRSLSDVVLGQRNCIISAARYSIFEVKVEKKNPNNLYI